MLKKDALKGESEGCQKEGRARIKASSENKKWKDRVGRAVFSFPRAAVTEFHKLGDFISHSPGGWNSKPRCLQSHTPSRASGAGGVLALSRSGSPIFLGLWVLTSNDRVPSGSASVSLLFLQKHISA